jgi:hypothetical protein
MKTRKGRAERVGLEHARLQSISDRAAGCGVLFLMGAVSLGRHNDAASGDTIKYIATESLALTPCLRTRLLGPVYAYAAEHGSDPRRDENSYGGNCGCEFLVGDHHPEEGWCLPQRDWGDQQGAMCGKSSTREDNPGSAKAGYTAWNRQIVWDRAVAGHAAAACRLIFFN